LAVFIGATAPSQADMGMKVRWRKHICAIDDPDVHPGSMPLAWMSRPISLLRRKAMKFWAAALFREPVESPAA
jgi:hypothetical protein